MCFRLSVFLKQGFLLPKTSHWELFGDGYCLQSILENFFTCKKFSNFQKCAFTDKVFRSLRRATKGFASAHHHLLKKVDENFYFSQTSECVNTSDRRVWKLSFHTKPKRETVCRFNLLSFWIFGSRTTDKLRTAADKCHMRPTDFLEIQ